MGQDTQLEDNEGGTAFEAVHGALAYTVARFAIPYKAI